MKPPALKPTSLVESLFDPSNSLIAFSLAIGIVYAVVPFLAYTALPLGEAYVKLAIMTAATIAAMFIGSRIHLFDYRFTGVARRIAISRGSFILVTWIVFLLFIVVTFATAPSIPFISALKGISSNELSQERGEFLKGREGAGIILLYLGAILVSTVVPYSIILLYSIKSKLRHFSSALFFLFCISFMQKALFLNLLLPLLAYMAIKRKLPSRIFIFIIGGAVALLFVTTLLSLGSESTYSNSDSSDYLSALYIPTGPAEYLIWRAVAVPIFTATDTLVVHAEQFGSNLLMGATSSLLSGIIGVERINLERFVFEHQFGGWNDTANANAVFITDIFVNFGWVGIIFFGVFVGLIFRWFNISQDIAFKSLWPLFAFGLFNATLIGMLFSNGFLYMIFHCLFVRVRMRDN